MVDPFVQWDPQRLRLVGFAAAIAGASVLLTVPLADLDATPRQRLVLAGAVGVSSYYSVEQLPALMTLVTFASVALAVGIPLVLSFRVVHDTVSN